MLAQFFETRCIVFGPAFSGPPFPSHPSHYCVYEAGCKLTGGLRA